jgi:hypothetical protein
VEGDDDAIYDLFDRRGYPLPWRGQVGERVRERSAHAESRSASARRQLPWREAQQDVGTPTRVAGGIHPGDDRKIQSNRVVTWNLRPDALGELPIAIKRFEERKARRRAR